MAKTMPATILKSHLLVLLATGLVSLSFISSEKLAGIVNPLSLTLLRFLGSALLLAPFILYKKERRIKILPTMPRTMIMGLVYAASFIGLFEALKTTTPLNTGTLFTLLPLMTAILAAIFLKTSIDRRHVLVYVTGALGTVWVIFEGQMALLLSFALNRGDLIFIFAVFAMCCYSILMKLLYRDDEMIVFVFCTIIASLLWIALALLLFKQPLQWDLIQGELIFHMGFLIIGATLVTMYLFQRTTVVLGPSRVNAYIFLNPAIVTLLLFVVEGVSVPVVIIPGLAISAFATVILQRLHSNDTSH